MLSFKAMAFLGFMFVMGTLLSLMMEQSYLGSTEVNDVNTAMTLKTGQVSGGFNIASPLQGTAFFTQTIPKVIAWDYDFFHGEWALIRILLIMTLSVPVVWSVSTTFMYVVSGIVSKFI